MADVSLSKAVRSNLLSLQNTASMMTKTQERLASGNKVNSALDNPTNFFTAQGLNSRASDLGLLMDSVSNAVQTISAADKGISAITKLVESAQSTARQALQTSAPSATITGTTTLVADSAATTGASPGALADMEDGKTIIINDGTTTQTYTKGTFNAGTRTFSTVAELEGMLRTDGVKATATGSTNLTLTATDNETALTVTGTGVSTGDLAFTAANLTPKPKNDADFQALVTGGYTLSIESAGRTETITFGTAAGQVSNRAGLEEALRDLRGVDAKLVDGKVSITTRGGNAFTVSASNAAVTTKLGLTAGETEATEGNTKRAEFVKQYNDILKQIDQLAKDASFNGVNLLNADNLQVMFNEEGTSKLDIAGTTLDARGLGLDEILDDQSWNTNAGINGTLDELKDAVEQLRTQASKFGSNLSVVENRQSFTKNMINVLQTGAANLTLADTNEEAANLLALQTRQSLSSTALSMASQADQSVLQLLR